MSEIASLVGSLGGVALLATIPIWFALTITLPWCCWSVTRNVAKTRRALERIADAVESGHRPGSGGVLGI